MATRFIQIHFLTSYPASLLNRDDVGFAKRLPFGGVTRIRISSQCLKRHWRRFNGENGLGSLDAPPSIRSRYTFHQLIYKPLVEEGVDPERARGVVEVLMAAVLGKSETKPREGGGAKKKGDTAGGAQEAAESKDAEAIRTEQVTVLGRPEVDYLLAVSRKLCADDVKTDEILKKLSKDKELRNNLQTLGCGCGLDAALFGRMVTADILARCDAAVHVAHAFTVHSEESESDYFSAVDDLLQGGDDDKLGSAHIGTTELTSGLYYGYVVVDLPLLVSNLVGCKREEWKDHNRELASRVVESLVYLVATVSPGAKLGSTAPHARAHCVIVETGKAQPRTLANAFLTPVCERPDLLANTFIALAEHMSGLDGMYGVDTERRLSWIRGEQRLLEACRVENAAPLKDVAAWAAEQVRGKED